MTRKELQERQSWSLEQKIDHSLGVIESFVNKMGGVDRVFLSFSGGKDSTVMLDLARRLYPDILAVFSNTGNEYPEILQFVRETKERGANVKVIYPKIKPREVWDKYGFPLVSKETAQRVHIVRNNPGCATSQRFMADSGAYKLAYKWRYLVDEPYETSAICCSKLKKEPMARFQRLTGRHPIVGTMASESLLRTTQYLKDGSCNTYGEKPTCKPMSIWTEEDIWEYIRRNNLPIAEIYHKGADRTGCVGCGFGLAFDGDERFHLLHKEHPKYYEMIMNYTNNGVTYREACRKLMDKCGKRLPDEELA